jgi:hypothetical protein
VDFSTAEISAGRCDHQAAILHPQDSAAIRLSLQVGAVLVTLLGAAAIWTSSDSSEVARLSADTRVVVRFPKAALADLLQQGIREEFVIQEQAGEMEVTGQAIATARVALDIESDQARETEKHAVLAVHVAGETVKNLVGRQANVTVMGTGHGEFTATKRIHFDGRAFTVDERTDVTASHETQIDDVETSVGGPFRLLASRKVRDAIPTVNEIAVARIKERVSLRIEQIVADVLPRLNAANRLEEVIAWLHPLSEDWRLQVTSNSNVVQAVLIPAGGQVPELPATDGDSVEVWVRLTPTQRLGIDLLTFGNQTHRFFSSLVPEEQARQLAEQLNIADINDWTRMEVAAAALHARGA